jgi:hypothetical protein
MHLFDLILDLGQGILLFCCAIAVICATTDRHRILGVTPPRFWFPILQQRANEAVASFEQVVAVAEGEQGKHYSSQKLHLAVLHAHFRCFPHGSQLPWFRPRRFVEELEGRCNQVIAQLEAAIEYQRSAAFMLEASKFLRLAREQLPERLAKDLQESESCFQRRLERLQEEKEAAKKRIRERGVVLGQEIEEQLGAIEDELQRFVAGTTITNLFA